LLVGVLALLVGLAIPREIPVRGQAPTAAEPLRTAGDRPIDIRHIRLDLNVDLPKKTVDARATLHVRSLRKLAAIPLDAVGFEVKRVTVQKDGDRAGRSAPFEHDGSKLTIDLDPAWPAEENATLRIDYRVREPKAGLYFFGPTRAEPDVPLTVWSQGEAVTNRYWIPCLDHPNQRQTTELVVTVAEGFEVLSNGKLVERRANPDSKTVTFHWKQDKPHVSYLVTLVVGKFDIVEEKWNKVPVLYYVPRGRKADIARTFGKTRRMLEFFSRRFGIAYPWDKYAQVVVEQFNAGGMENTSATTLTDRALLDARAALDTSADGLIAHELAHQWWGDLVTCRDWAHIWLNEGFASFAEVLWAEYDQGADEGAYNLLQKARVAIAGGKARPIVDRRYASPLMMFDARAYPKGAWVLHMLRRRLGDKAFWKGIQRYGTEHRLRSVETSDFRKTLEKVTGRSLERFFYDWTERPGNPAVSVQTEYLPQTKQSRVVVKQTQPGEAFHFPLTVAFTTAGAASPVVHRQLIKEKDQTLYVGLPGRPIRVDVDPEQAVLAEFSETKSRGLWLAQLSAAPSVALRARAAAHFGQSKNPADREALAKALAAEKFWAVQSEIAAALGASGGDTCRDALIKGLANAHPKVRRACAAQLGQFHKDAWAAAALKALLRKGDASYSVEAAALGAYARLGQADTVATLLPWLAKPSLNDMFQTTALGGLGQSQDLSALDTLLSWTKRGKSRFCRSAALLALAQLARSANPSEAQRKKIVAAVSACLDGEHSVVLTAAVMALRDLGQAAAPSLATLEAIQRHDPNERVRELAKQSIEKIRSNTPVPVELKKLREELDRLKRANEALQDRLNRFEKKERKGA
jgi:aminopeptidase N